MDACRKVKKYYLNISGTIAQFSFSFLLSYLEKQDKVSFATKLQNTTKFQPEKALVRRFRPSSKTY